MADALIGHTGFVGGNLCRQRKFDQLFNSKNIERIAGQSFDTITCSGMPAAKWIANRDPQGDATTLERLWTNLRSATARRVVLISTIDVYPEPVDVDEDSPIDLAVLNPYGRHRRMLELFVADHFSNVLIVRLPGLFGPGLKKNAIYDLLHENQVDQLHPDASFQWYDIQRLVADIDRSIAEGIGVLNVTSEPMTLGQMARAVFDRELTSRPSTTPARYDFRSKFADRWGGSSGYLYRGEEVLDDLRRYVNQERARS